MTSNNTRPKALNSARISMIAYISSTTIFVLSSRYPVNTTQFRQFLSPTFSGKEIAMAVWKAATPLHISRHKMSSETLLKL